MKHLLIVLAGALLLFSCTRAPKTEAEAVESFSEFIVEFCADKQYQLSHIKFPLGVLPGMITNEDIQTGGHSKVEFTEDLWFYLDADDFSIDKSLYEGEPVEQGGFEVLSPTRIKFTKEGLLVGYLQTYTFEYDSGEWYVIEGNFHSSGVDTYEDSVKETARVNAQHEWRTPRIEEFDLPKY